MLSDGIILFKTNNKLSSYTTHSCHTTHEGWPDKEQILVVLSPCKNEEHLHILFCKYWTIARNFNEGVRRKVVLHIQELQYRSYPYSNYCCLLAAERDITVKWSMPEKNTAWVLCNTVVSEIVSWLPGGWLGWKSAKLGEFIWITQRKGVLIFVAYKRLIFWFSLLPKTIHLVAQTQ